MKKKIQVLPSGIPLIDLAWGGFYRGGTYFLVGPRKSGRTVLALQYSHECAKQGEVCLYFTNTRPKDLVINAASIDFDLQYYMNHNSIIVVKVTPPQNIDQAENPDSYLVEYLKDIKTVVNQYHPNKLVFDELTPFVGFKNRILLKDTFLETIEDVEDRGITSLYVLGEPASPASHLLADALLSASTGFISLEKEGDYLNRKQPGEMTITPNVGHAEGKFSSAYYIEPYQGVKVDYKPQLSELGISFEDEKKYKSLSEIELRDESLTISNQYTLDDFKLLLNNQIAFYKSTRQAFTLISIRMAEDAEKNKMLSINQLKNAVRLSTERKDKLCVVGNKVIVMFTKEEEINVNKFMAKVIKNLPDADPQYRNNILKYLSVYAAKVTEEVKHADDMFEQLFADDHPERFRFGFL